MKTLYVRVNLKKGIKQFYRCGFSFDKSWLKVDVDKATADRLEEEQMLEVSETKPADLEETSAGDSANNSPSVGGSSNTSSVPEDPAIRLEAIRAAIGKLDKENLELWTAAGKPKTEAISVLTCWPVTAAERDAALAVSE